MKNINRTIVILLLSMYNFDASEIGQLHNKDMKHLLRAINNETRHVKQRFRNKVKMVPISYLPNIAANPLHYPGKNPEALKIIEEEWNNYYKCLSDQVQTYERERMIPFIATSSFIGTTLKLECGLCQSPIDVNLSPEWHYSDTYNMSTANILRDIETNVISVEDNSLSIYNIQYRDSGLYFCSLKNISGPNYFVHVTDDSEPLLDVWPETAPNAEHTLPHIEFPELNIVIKTEWTEWTNCNRCGHTGKRMRYGACVVITTEKSSEEADKNDLLILYYFKEGIPCRSKLLPEQVLQMKEVMQRPNQIMFSFCKVPCKETEVFVEEQQLDKGEAVFNNSMGVFSLNQLLPPLNPLPERTTIYARYDSKTIIRCPGNLNTDTPVLWSIGLKQIFGPSIGKETNYRITINNLNQIVINKVRFSDMQMYSCWQNKELAGSTHLIVFHPPSNTMDKFITIFTGCVIVAYFLFLFYRAHKNKFLPKLR